MNPPVRSGDQKLRILVFSFSQISTDPRVLRQVTLLQNQHTITTAGFGDYSAPGVTHVQLVNRAESNKLRGLTAMIARALRLHRLSLALSPMFRDARTKLAGSKWDLVISNDVLSAPITSNLVSKHGVIFDLHEYSPRQGEDNWKWRLVTGPLMRWVLRKEIAGRAAAVTTVGKGIADEYRREFGINAEVVVNATPKHELQVNPVSSPIRLVHSGIPGPARKLELMIDAVRNSTANVTLDLYLMQRNFEYLDLLKKHAGDDPRIKFCDPVPYDELVPTLNRYDLGVTFIPPTTFNLKWGLPNKLFDYVQARLGVLAGPSPEMARYITRYGIGTVTEDFATSTFSRLLEGLSVEQVLAWKQASHSSAEELSGEYQAEVWAEIVARVTDT